MRALDMTDHTARIRRLAAIHHHRRPRLDIYQGWFPGLKVAFA
jgi:hypothetical protein